MVKFRVGAPQHVQPDRHLGQDLQRVVVDVRGDPPPHLLLRGDQARTGQTMALGDGYGLRFRTGLI